MGAAKRDIIFDPVIPTRTDSELISFIYLPNVLKQKSGTLTKVEKGCILWAVKKIQFMCIVFCVTMPRVVIKDINCGT